MRLRSKTTPRHRRVEHRHLDFVSELSWPRPAEWCKCEPEDESGDAHHASMIGRPKGNVRFVAVIIGAILLALISVVGVNLYDTEHPSPPSVPSYLTRPPDAAASRLAWKELRAASATANQTCVAVNHNFTSMLPTPYLRCSYKGPGEVSEVTYTIKGRRSEGFLFMPAAPTLPSTRDVPGNEVPGGADACIKHLDGPWWSLMPEGTLNPYTCPPGFLFVDFP